MQLLYLDFEFSDEASGRGSFDAMASVLPDRLPALLAETAAVLRWARRAFGPPGALEGDGEWDFELQALADPGTPLPVAWDEGGGGIALAPAPDGARVTLTLTLSGSRAFCEGLREAFGVDG